jgi:hypothetical protein
MATNVKGPKGCESERREDRLNYIIKAAYTTIKKEKTRNSDMRGIVNARTEYMCTCLQKE